MSDRVKIGYSAPLERFSPSEAVEFAAYAESCGFSGTLATDHFQPWLPKQGQSSFVWSVLGAIGERTRGDLGPGMAVAGYRYHPATVAQASATLASMYEGRYWLGIGSGEALNEHMMANYWPEAPERINRMFEAIELIKRLFHASIAGKDTRFSGDFYRMEATRLWTMPEVAPPVMVATGGPVTAKKAGKYADGLVTVGASYDQCAQVLERFRQGSRENGRDPADLTAALHFNLSWAPTYEEALRNAVEHWPTGAMRFPKGDIRTPHIFEQIAKLVRPEDLVGRLVISEDLDIHRAEIQRYVDLGFDRIYLNNVGANAKEWIQTFGAKVLPALTGPTKPTESR